MNPVIKTIQAVSDGIVVEFHGGIRCYFSAAFLLQNVNRGSNHIFLDYDPTPLAFPDLLSPGAFPHSVSLVRPSHEN
jgi:hypothetical protein